MDITSNNDILKMYKSRQLEEKMTLSYWLKKLPRKDEFRWLKVPALNLLRVTRNIILLVGLALPLHAVLLSLRMLGKLLIRLPKRSEFITLTRPSNSVGRLNNLPMSITRFSRGEVS